jgi:NAD(P)H-flavin reductase
MSFKILKREQFSPVTYLWELAAPDIARAALPGHFVIIRHGQGGERIPLTIADFDRERGTITLVIQAVGKTTIALMELKEGEELDDLVGPLGKGRKIEKVGKVVCVGGGLGVAPVFPQLRGYKQQGAQTISIVGFRNKDLMFWTDKFAAQSDELLVTTDDGSHGIKGFVTTALEQVLEREKDVDEVLAIGPAVMMKACAELTRPRGIHTVVSLNPIMVDGTGMCGGCRVSVGGKMVFACVDGPEFDGHKVDFDELLLRARRFEREEKESLEQYKHKNPHACRIGL